MAYRVGSDQLAWLPSTNGNVSDCRSRVRKFSFQLGHITFVEMAHEIISSPSADSRRSVVSSWQKYVHKILVTGLLLRGLRSA